jgi:hypothetical protein
MGDKVGIDIGNSSIKYFSDLGYGEIPTWRARGEITQIVPDANSQLSAIRYNGESLILGEDAVLGTNFMWKTDEEKNDEQFYTPFILLALARMGITNADIVLGLPVSTAASKKKVDRVKEAYSGTKEAFISGRTITFTTRASVMAEPLGTYLSLVLDENNRYIKNSPFLQDQVAIVDIGYRTVDFVILDRGKLATTHTSMSGMVQLFDGIKSFLEIEYGKMRPNEEVRIYNKIINHFGVATLKIAGEHVRPDFWKRASELKSQMARDLSDEVRVFLSKIRPDKVMLTGGGALFLKDELMNNNRNFQIHHNPRFANVMGFYRAAKTMPEETNAGGANAGHRDHITTVQSR